MMINDKREGNVGHDIVLITKKRAPLNCICVLMHDD